MEVGRNDFINWNILREQGSEFLLSLKAAHVIDSIRGKCALVITHNDDVFAIGHTFSPTDCGGWICDQYFGPIDAHNPNKPRKIKALCQQQIQSFTCYCNFAFAALNEHGRLFTWGHSFDSQTPKLVEGELADKKVVQIVLGKEHRLALTDKGQVYYWGFKSVNGYLVPSKPKRVKGAIGDRKAVAVACGPFLAVVLLEDGHLFNWRVLNDDQCNPVPVGGLLGKTVKQVVCGFEENLALTDSGQVFTWDGTNGVHFTTDQKHPTEYMRRYGEKEPVLIVCQFGKAVQIAAFEQILAVKFEDDTVRAWGTRTDKETDHWGKRSWVLCASIDEAFAPYSMWRTVVKGKTVADQQILAHKYDTLYNFMHWIYTGELLW